MTLRLNRSIRAAPNRRVYACLSRRQRSGATMPNWLWLGGGLMSGVAVGWWVGLLRVPPPQPGSSAAAAAAVDMEV